MGPFVRIDFANAGERRPGRDEAGALRAALARAAHDLAALSAPDGRPAGRPCDRCTRRCRTTGSRPAPDWPRPRRDPAPSRKRSGSRCRAAAERPPEFRRARIGLEAPCVRWNRMGASAPPAPAPGRSPEGQKEQERRFLSGAWFSRWMTACQGKRAKIHVSPSPALPAAGWPWADGGVDGRGIRGGRRGCRQVPGRTGRRGKRRQGAVRRAARGKAFRYSAEDDGGAQEKYRFGRSEASAGGGASHVRQPRPIRLGPVGSSAIRGSSRGPVPLWNSAIVKGVPHAWVDRLQLHVFESVDAFP